MKQTDPNSTPLHQEAGAQRAHTPKSHTAEELPQELQTRQVELEIQNEQLRQLQAVLEESLAHYVDFFEYAPIGYFILNHNGMIDEVNFTGATLLGVARSKLIHHNFDFFVATEDRQRWQSHFIKVLTCDDKLTCEVAFQHDVDPRFDTQLDCQCLRKTGKKPVVRVVLTNISKRKQIEYAREEALSRLQKISSMVPGVVYQYRLHPDGSSCLPFASNAIREIYRVSPEEVREDASKIYAILHPDDYDGVIASIQASAQNLSPWHHEYRVKFDDGTVRWLFGNALPQKETDGSVLWHGFITDITNRKQADEALRQSETKFRTLYDSTSDAVMLLDKKGFLDCNKATLAIFGCATKEELCSKHPAELSPPEQPCGTSSLALADQHIATAMERGNCQFEWVHRRSNTGKSFFADVLLNSMVLDDKTVLQATVRDITERKQIEEKLRGSENRNRLLVENSPVCIHEIGMDGRITSMNPAGLRMMGTEDECAVRGFLYLDAVSAADRERIGELLDKAYAGETSHFEFKASGPQGLIFKSCFVPIRNKEGSVEKLMGITEDITERKQAEEKLQKFFDLIPELACVASTDGRFLKINPAWQTTLGYTEQEILSTPFLDFIHPDDRDATMEEVARQLAGEATMRFTNRYRHKDGSYRWLEWTATSDVDKKLLYASARDITARNQTDE